MSVQGVSKDIIVLILNADVIICNDNLYVLFDANVAKIFTVFCCSTVAGKNRQVIRGQATPFDAYNYLITKFGSNPVEELRKLRMKFRNIRCPNLSEYIHNFELLISEYEEAGGNRYENVIIDSFLSQLSDEKYKTFKMFFTGETIDDAIEYYRPIADKENIQRNNSGSMIRSFQASLPNEREGVRCKQCMGVGHTSETCSTAPGTCFHCGLTGHTRKKCPSKNKKCWLKMKQAVLEIMNDAQQEDNNDIEPNDSADSDSSVSDVCTDDEDDIPEEEFSSPTLQARTTRIQGRMAIMKSSPSCNCTFHNDCLRIALDSGCTRHISGVPVTNAKTIEETTIIDAAGNKNIAKVEGDLDVHTRKKRFIIRNVKYCPSIDGTLLSVKQLIDEGYLVEFKQNCATIYTIISSISYYLLITGRYRDCIS